MSLNPSGLVFAFMAGIFSLISPCGYILLPGYISYYLGSKLSFGKAVSGGLACTAGLITVFSIMGVLASSLGTLLPQLIPLLEIIAGAMVTFMGIINLIGLSLPYPSIPTRISKRKGAVGLYFFGVAYGLAGVGCSAPVFLSVVFYAMAKGLAYGTSVFIAYAVGMGLPLILTSVLLAKAKKFLIKRITTATPWLQKVSGVLLIIVGIYLIYSRVC